MDRESTTTENPTLAGKSLDCHEECPEYAPNHRPTQTPSFCSFGPRTEISTSFQPINVGHICRDLTPISKRIDLETQIWQLAAEDEAEMRHPAFGRRKVMWARPVCTLLFSLFSLLLPYLTCYLLIV